MAPDELEAGAAYVGGAVYTEASLMRKALAALPVDEAEPVDDDVSLSLDAQGLPSTQAGNENKNRR